MYVRDLPSTDCPFLSAVRAEFAHWNWTYHKGYIRYNLRGELHYEHALVVERAFGIVTSSEIHSHHLNGNRLDNQATNLAPIPSGAHAHLHNSGTANQETCDECGSTFLERPFKRKRQKRIFCSRNCYLAFARKTNLLNGYGRRSVMPPRDELLKLYRQCHQNKSELARRLQVDKSTIFRWFRNLKAPHQTRTGMVALGTRNVTVTSAAQPPKEP